MSIIDSGWGSYINSEETGFVPVLKKSQWNFTTAKPFNQLCEVRQVWLSSFHF